MDAIKRNAEIVNDEITERHSLEGLRLDADGHPRDDFRDEVRGDVLDEDKKVKLSTADLADAGTRDESPVRVLREETIAVSDDAVSLAPGEPAGMVDKDWRRSQINAVSTPSPTAVQGRAASGAAAAPAVEGETGPLFSPTEANELRGRWDAIQVGFVDQPRGAVEQADNLVAGTMKRLAEVFAAERSKLEGQWDKGENVSTEDLRLALRRYRSFFGRLLNI